MSSRRSWICDGVSKNSKQYPGIYTPHQPHENYGSHCQICGKSREAMIPNQSSERLSQPVVSLHNNTHVPPRAISERLTPVVSLHNNSHVSRRVISSETWQLSLLFGIPVISVIIAFYVLITPLLKARIELSQSYENNNYGIKIKYPPNWGVQDKQDPTVTGDIAVLFPPEKTENNDCQTSLTMAVDDFKENPPSVEEYKNSVMQKINALNQNTKMTDASRAARLSNSSAYKLVYTRQDGTCRLQAMEVGTIRNNKAYYITYKAPPHTYDKFLKPVEEMINSFEIKEANN